MKDIKIFVSHRIDKNSTTINNDIFIPVRCGAVFDKNNTSILGDDTGDNISSKRMSFCELTVLYWAWKNTSADYYGLCHYRRYLAFTDEKFEKASSEHDNNCVKLNNFDEIYSDKYGINRNNIEKYVNDYDILLCESIDLNKYNTTNYGAMKSSPDYHNMSDVDLAIEIIKEKYPHMSSSVDKYMHGTKSRLYNCFVMRKDIFNDYCEWIFDILFELEHRIDMSKYSMQKFRTPGTIGERLLGIYITFIEDCKKYKIKELPLLFIENTEKEEELLPYFNKNNIAIASNFDNNYAKVFCSALISAKESFSKENNYDIIILTRDITDESKKNIESIVEGCENIHIRYTNPSAYLSNISKNIRHEVYTEDLYYRVVVPYILKNYEKVLVIDADIIVCRDLADIYNENIDGYLAGAVRDTVMQGYLNGLVPDQIDYAKTVLNMSEPYDYFNSGICLMNCAAIRKKYSLSYIRNFIKKYIDIVRIYEQDMLNILFYSHVKFLDQEWNFYTKSNDWVTKCLDYCPMQSKVHYDEVRKNPAIVHYAAAPKPWKDTSVDFAPLWWKYTRKSPYYEEFLMTLTSFDINKTITSTSFASSTPEKQNELSIYKIFEYIEMFLITKYRYIYKLDYYMSKSRYIYYSIMSKLPHFKNTEKYKNKKRTIKKLIKDKKQLLKNHKHF